MFRSEDIIQMVSEGCPGFHVNIVKDILPSRHDVDTMLEKLSPNPIHSSLAVVETLLLSDSAFEDPNLSQLYDDEGYSSYARLTSGLLRVFVQDRQIAKENMWALRHFLALALYANDFLRIPWGQSPAFNRRALKAGLDDMILKVQQVTTYLLTSSPDDGWRSNVIAVVNGDKSIENSDMLARFLVDLIRNTQRLDNIREARILRNVLHHVLDKADKDEADQWVLLARRKERTSAHACLEFFTVLTVFVI